MSLLTRMVSRGWPATVPHILAILEEMSDENMLPIMADVEKLDFGSSILISVSLTVVFVIIFI